VPDYFIAPVPIYASTGVGHTVYLGTVTATGPETSFTFKSAAEPRKLVVDSRLTLLCIPE
jgi:hypothetical protein